MTNYAVPPITTSNQQLHVVTCISNPAGWKTRIALYKQFEKHMLDSGVKLTTVELVYGNRQFEISKNPLVSHVQVRANSVVWNKENLINIGIASLPHDAQYIAWIDADIEFLDLDWANKTIHALQQYSVVQPWSYCVDLGPVGETLETHTSFCKIFWEGREIQVPNKTTTFAHPGYAWAATRKALTGIGGLLEVGALGAGDHHMALGMIGRAIDSVHGGAHQNYKAQVLAWEQKSLSVISKNIAAIPGSIHHYYHGSKAKRNYIGRWDILIKNNFDPITDTQKNWMGVIELTGNKPDFRLDIDRYFRLRNEDSID